MPESDLVGELQQRPEEPQTDEDGDEPEVGLQLAGVRYGRADIDRGAQHDELAAVLVEPPVELAQLPDDRDRPAGLGRGKTVRGRRARGCVGLVRRRRPSRDLRARALGREGEEQLVAVPLPVPVRVAEGGEKRCLARGALGRRRAWLGWPIVRADCEDLRLSRCEF